MLSSKELSELLKDTVTLAVLDIIAEEKRVPFKDLGEAVKRFVGQPVDVEDLRERLDWLKDVKLIAEEPAPVIDFSTYYITADGLLAERQLHDVKPTSRSSWFAASGRR